MLIEGAIADGFAPPEARDFYEVVDGVPALLARLAVLGPVAGGVPSLL